MKRIYDWDAKFSLRNYTAADLRALYMGRLQHHNQQQSGRQASQDRLAFLLVLPARQLARGPALQLQAVLQNHRVTALSLIS